MSCLTPQEGTIVTPTTSNRREFVSRTLAAGIAASGASAWSEAGPARSRTVKVGLYSITYLGVWYRGEALTLRQVVDRAREYGYDGVEIDGKRPHGNPLDWPRSKCRELRSYAKDRGIDIYSVAANNDFSSPIPEFREAQIAFVKELLRMTADLGVGVVRMFLAWPGVTLHPQIARYGISRGIWEASHKGSSEEEIWAWCRAGMIEATRYAADLGITLALQNHAPVIKDHRDVLRMVKEVGSPNLKVCLDAPIMVDKRPEAVRQAALEVGSLQVLSHFGGDYKREPDGAIKGEDFYPVFVKAMKEIGYRGYIGYELCHPLPEVNGQTVGVEYVDESALSACRYMRGLIEKA
jgi:sugar phosphate isomerase/epimerase